MTLVKLRLNVVRLWLVGLVANIQKIVKRAVNIMMSECLLSRLLMLSWAKWSGSLQRARLPITGCLIINLLIMLHTMLNKWNLNLLMIGKEHFCAYPSTDVDFTGYVMSLTSWLHSELAKVEPTGQSWPVIWFSLAQQIMNHDYYEITILVIFCFIFSWPKKYSLNIKDI